MKSTIMLGIGTTTLLAACSSNKKRKSCHPTSEDCETFEDNP